MVCAPFFYFYDLITTVNLSLGVYTCFTDTRKEETYAPDKFFAGRAIDDRTDR